MIMNPIFASSAKRRMRSARMPIILTLYGALILMMSFFAALYVIGYDTLNLDSLRAGLDGYVTIMAMQLALIVLISPAMTAGSISGERERQTLDLLLVTNTSSMSIAIGKLMESFSFLILLIVSSFPMMCVPLLFGAITIFDIALSMLYLMTVALAALSVGLIASAVFKRTITATIAAYLSIFIIGGGTLISVAFVPTKVLSQYLAAPGGLDAVSLVDKIKLIPAPAWLSPILGMVALISEQTGILERTIQYTLPVGSQAYAVFQNIGFGLAAYINMGLLCLSSLLLTGISALFIRPRVGRRRRKEKKQ